MPQVVSLYHQKEKGQHKYEPPRINSDDQLGGDQNLAASFSNLWGTGKVESCLFRLVDRGNQKENQLRVPPIHPQILAGFFWKQAFPFFPAEGDRWIDQFCFGRA